MPRNRTGPCPLQTLEQTAEMTRRDQTKPGKAGDIPPNVSEQIDENLKRLYSDAASEDLPPSLMELLDALRSQDAQQSAGDQ